MLGSGKFAVAEALNGSRYVRYHYDIGKESTDLLFSWDGHKTISIVNIEQEKEVDSLELSSTYWPHSPDKTKVIDAIINEYLDKSGYVRERNQR